MTIWLHLWLAMHYIESGHFSPLVHNDIIAVLSDLINLIANSCPMVDGALQGTKPLLVYESMTEMPSTRLIKPSIQKQIVAQSSLVTCFEVGHVWQYNP